MKNKNNQIQGLRGIAILGIVIFHATIQFSNLYLNGSYNFPLENIVKLLPSIGVYIFFVLSGIFIAGNSKFNIKKYIFNKFNGIYIPYLVSIIIIFILTMMFSLPGRTVTIFEFIENIFLVNGFIGVNYVDGSHWYLTVLLSFTLSFVMLNCIRIKSKKSISLLVFVWLLLFDFSFVFFNLNSEGFIGAMQYWVNLLLFNWYPHYFLLFLSGMLLMRLDESEKQEDRLIMLIIVLIHSYFIVGDYFFWNHLFVLLVVYSCLNNKFKILENRLCVYLGDISYYWYLIHQNIIYVVEYFVIVQLDIKINFFVICLSILVSYGMALVVKWLSESIKEHNHVIFTRM